MTGEDTTGASHGGSARPKYQQLADDVRRGIRSGRYGPGSLLPSKAALMETHRVALGTVNEALRVLRGEGLLETRQGTGTYVCDPLPNEETQPEGEAEARRTEEITDLRWRVSMLETALVRLYGLVADEEWRPTTRPDDWDGCDR